MANPQRPQNFKVSRKSRMLRKAWTKSLVLNPGYSRLKRMLIFLLALSLLFFFLDYLNVQVVRNLRSRIADMVVPIGENISIPFKKLGSLYTSINELFSLKEEVAALRQKNRRLEEALYKTSHHAIENHYLRLLSQLIPTSSQEHFTTIVLGYPGHPFIKNILIRGGHSQGLQKDMPLLNHQGLIGRIVQTNETSSFGLLITDINSRVPATILPTRLHTIVSGNNTPSPILSYVDSSEVNKGEVVVTSGEGGIFPPGIPIGQISEIDEDGTIYIQPFASLDDLAYLQAWQPLNSKIQTS